MILLILMLQTTSIVVDQYPTLKECLEQKSIILETAAEMYPKLEFKAKCRIREKGKE